MKKLRPFMLPLFVAICVVQAGAQTIRTPSEVMALRYVAVDDAFRKIKQKLGETAAGAIVLLDPRSNVIAINSAHTEASSARALVTALDQRPPGANIPKEGTEWLTVETRGVAIDLPAAWQPFEQPTNFFIQKRARHPEHGIEMNAGAFKFDLPVGPYAGVVAACLATKTSERLDHIAERVDSTRSEIERAKDSRAGRTIADHVAKASSSARFELIDVFYQDLADTKQYDIRSKTSADSKPILYRRDFILAGVAPNEIVQVTYIGPSEEVFKNKDIIRSVRKERVK